VVAYDLRFVVCCPPVQVPVELKVAPWFGHLKPLDVALIVDPWCGQIRDKVMNVAVAVRTIATGVPLNVVTATPPTFARAA